MFSNTFVKDRIGPEIAAQAGEDNIFERMLAGGPLPMDDPQYHLMQEIVALTMPLVAELSVCGSADKARKIISEILNQKIDESTTVFPPFYTNFGRFISIGKNVFINHACSFLDMGGIAIEDNVLIGPRVNIVTENHPIASDERRTLLLKPVRIKRNAWIGAAATMLPGVTVGENSIVAAGALVSADVPNNVVVAGVPAKVIKSIDQKK